MKKQETDVLMTSPDGKQTTEVCNDASVEVMQRNGWTLAKGAKPTPVANPEETEASALRAKQDEAAKASTAAELKDALRALEIKFAANASKADLFALYLNR